MADSSGLTHAPVQGGDRVAVVIVNYNAGDHLRRVVEGLANQSRPADRVILVDNGSTDGSLEGLLERLPGLQVVEPGSNLGFAAGNNLGVRVARDCQWIALLNPDAIPDREWLAELMDAAERESSCPLFASRLLVDGRPDLLDGTGDLYFASGLAARRDHGSPMSDDLSDEPVFGACGAAALVNRAAFVAVGGFCERFFCYYEDVDLAFRLRLAGGRCRYVPGSVVGHVGSLTTGRESDFTLYHSHRNLVWAFVSNMPRGLLLCSLPQHLLANLGTVIWYSFRGHPVAMLRAKRDALLGLGWALRRRRQIQGSRVALDDEIKAAFADGAKGWATFARRASGSLRGGVMGGCGKSDAPG